MAKKAKKRAPGPSSAGGDDGDLLRRALAAWFRAGNVDQPCSCSDVEVHARRRYVVLRGGRGPTDLPMAVYRVKNDGNLRRLRRWPTTIEA
jgi:hypothetical protein